MPINKNIQCQLRIILITIICTSYQLYLVAQNCNTGPITLATQADIDAFATNYPSCILIDDPICIGDCTPPYVDSDITNLNGLSQLTTLWHSLDIGYNPNLINLTGLHNITEMGPVHIYHNDGLYDLTGLTSVASTSQINVNNCAAITSLYGLDALTNMGSLQVLSNPNLTSLTGLENVTDGGLNLNSCNTLSDISALSNLVNCGSLNIFNCASITDISALSGVTSAYSLRLTSNNGLSNLIGLENITSLDERIEIHNCDNLLDLDELSAIISIGSFIKISFNDNLSDISGLANIDPASISSSIGSIDDLEIYNNPLLADCNITSICGALIDEGATADIHDNLTGCNSDTEIEALCPSPLSCTNLTNPTNTSTQVPVDTDLSWTNVPDATGYKIKVGTTTNGSDIANNLDIGLVTTYNLPNNLPYNTDIFVTITPYDSNGDAMNCSEESFTTSLECSNIYNPQSGAPDIPLDQDIFWFAASGATGYKLTMGTSSNGTDILDNVDVGNVLQYDPGNLPPNSTIYALLIPYNTGGDAVSCTEINFMTTTNGGLACSQLVAPIDGSTNIAVNTIVYWESVPDATGYKINVGTSSGGTDIADGLDVGNNLDYNASAYPFNTEIFITIIPYDGAGDASACQEESFNTTIACTALTTPLPNSTNIPLDSDIIWNSVMSATGYKISLSTSSGSNDLVDNLDVGLTTTYDPIVDFAYGTTVFVLVTPYYADGDAQNCTETPFNTEPAPGPCQVTNTNDSGDGSLRNAILCAEVNAGVDIIDFVIPGSGPHSIALLGELPVINDDYTTLDGTTQSGNFPMSGQIIIDATAIPGSNKKVMVINGSNSSLYGLSFENHDLEGVSTALFYGFGADSLVVGDSARGNWFVEDNWTSAIFLKENINKGVIQSNTFKSATLGLKNGITVNSGTNQILIGGDSSWMTNKFHNFSHNAVELRNGSNQNNIINNHFEGNGTAIFNNGNLFNGSNMNNDYRGNIFLCNTTGIDHTINANSNIQPPVIQLSKINYITGTGLPGAFIEIYSSPDTCSTGECQGQIVVGKDTCNINGEFMILLHDFTLDIGDKVTAIQTDQVKGSSQFATCAVIDEDCVGYVYTCDDFLVGSLRDAVECSVANDVILFLDHLVGETIMIEDQIYIDKDLTITGLGNPTTTLLGESVAELFVIEATADVTIQDLRICASEDMSDPIIYNLGNLSLSNITIIDKRINTSQPLISNEDPGLLTIENSVEIKK